jgi:E3 ubiquitin-protein ligase listerin
MAKAKSSASSATRKKHEKKAAKAAANGDEPPPPPQQPAQRGQKKQKKDRFAPKVKTYTPPPPPPKGAPDPVDLYLSGGSAVDAELVVILRKLGKRDESTIGKGVEGLEEWVEAVLDEERQASKSGEDDEGWKLELRRNQVVESMNVWVSI